MNHISNNYCLTNSCRDLTGWHALIIFFRSVCTDLDEIGIDHHCRLHDQSKITIEMRRIHHPQHQIFIISKSPSKKFAFGRRRLTPVIFVSQKRAGEELSRVKLKNIDSSDAEFEQFMKAMQSGSLRSASNILLNQYDPRKYILQAAHYSNKRSNCLI